MSAADLLRTALDDAPNLRVEGDAFDELAVWDEHDDIVFRNYGEEGQAATRLLGLLLAAAPHLADLLECIDLEAPLPSSAAAARVVEAMAEAGESL